MSPDFIVRQNFKSDAQDFEGTVNVSSGVIKKINASHGAGGPTGIDYLQANLIGQRFDLNMIKNFSIKIL